MTLRTLSSLAIPVLIALPFMMPAFAQDKKPSTTAKKPSKQKEKSKTPSPKAEYPAKAAAPKPNDGTSSEESTLPFDAIFGAAGTQIYFLEESLAEGKKFSPKDNARNAKVLAVMEQVLSEQKEDSPRQKMSPTVRDGALKIAQAKTAAEAKKELDAAKKATESPPKAKPQVAWETLIDVPTIMQEIQIQHGKLGTFMKTGKVDGDLNHQMVVLWSLGVALQKIQPKLKDESERKAWGQFAKSYTSDMAMTYSLYGRGGQDAMKLVWQNSKSCSACHEKFKPKK